MKLGCRESGFYMVVLCNFSNDITRFHRKNVIRQLELEYEHAMRPNYLFLDSQKKDEKIDTKIQT